MFGSWYQMHYPSSKSYHSFLKGLLLVHKGSIYHRKHFFEIFKMSFCFDLIEQFHNITREQFSELQQVQFHK